MSAQDSEVIEEILRCNRGSVERTIDQLLSITSDNQVRVAQTLARRNFNAFQSTQNEKFMRDDPDVIPGSNVNQLKTSETSDAQNGRTSKWNPVLLPLNNNFLRLGVDRSSDDYCDEFAVMLQNEEFLAELRFAPTFS